MFCRVFVAAAVYECFGRREDAHGAHCTVPLCRSITVIQWQIFETAEDTAAAVAWLPALIHRVSLDIDKNTMMTTHNDDDDDDGPSLISRQVGLLCSRQHLQSPRRVN